MCQVVLPGPEASARAAAAASNKQRAAAEAAMVACVTDTLHLIAALRGALPLMAGEGRAGPGEGGAGGCSGVQGGAGGVQGSCGGQRPQASGCLGLAPRGRDGT